MAPVHAQMVGRRTKTRLAWQLCFNDSYELYNGKGAQAFKDAEGLDQQGTNEPQPSTAKRREHKATAKAKPQLQEDAEDGEGDDLEGGGGDHGKVGPQTESTANVSAKFGAAGEAAIAGGGGGSDRSE